MKIFASEERRCLIQMCSSTTSSCCSCWDHIVDTWMKIMASQRGRCHMLDASWAQLLIMFCHLSCSHCWIGSEWEGGSQRVKDLVIHDLANHLSRPEEGPFASLTFIALFVKLKDHFKVLIDAALTFLNNRGRSRWNQFASIITLLLSGVEVVEQKCCDGACPS